MAYCWGMDGLCKCGCGQRTRIARQTRTDLGHVAGKPTAYLRGHARRKSPPPFPDPDRTGIHLVPLLRNGAVIAHALIDSADAQLVTGRYWGLEEDYAAASGLFMHRLILGLEPRDGCVADHKNRDKLDNRRENLRIVTRRSNPQNVDALGGTSRFRGVHWHPGAKKWRAMIYHDGRSRHVGYFADEHDAARAAERARLAVMPGALPQYVEEVTHQTDIA